MSKAFGTKFIVLNDVRQLLDSKVFAGGPWLHLATVSRGLKEYMAFKHYVPGGNIYLEEWDSSTGQFKEIKSEAEYEDLYRFLWSKGLLLSVCTDMEHKIAST